MENLFASAMSFAVATIAFGKCQVRDSYILEFQRFSAGMGQGYILLEKAAKNN
ncbi:MAG: hypothetical protein JKY36_08500 [Erythrobacter sp.]|nr:hypothetical protein [Erythrobacter sp.]|tara:strand:+ start:32 stop:190 length:159 start_codon:yes stop_codon:yes gene_type:complete